MSTFISHVVINTVNNWCSKDLETTHSFDWDRHYAKTAYVQDFSFDFDLGAVVPIAIRRRDQKCC